MNIFVTRGRWNRTAGSLKNACGPDATISWKPILSNNSSGIKDSMKNIPVTSPRLTVLFSAQVTRCMYAISEWKFHILECSDYENLKECSTKFLCCLITHFFKISLDLELISVILTLSEIREWPTTGRVVLAQDWFVYPINHWPKPHKTPTKKTGQELPLP